jgi:hypothetical protein
MTSGLVDTFGDYVKFRLTGWGNEFALHRDIEIHGSGCNILQMLIEHAGEIPQRSAGVKPVEVDLYALEIEQIVAEIARDQMPIACCLRGYYCGRGRRGYERLETANLLLGALRLRQVRRRQYLGLVEHGQTIVRGWLLAVARAA